MRQRPPKNPSTCLFTTKESSESDDEDENEGNERIGPSPMQRSGNSTEPKRAMQCRMSAALPLPATRTRFYEDAPAATDSPVGTRPPS